MRTIVVTGEAMLPGEARLISRLLTEGCVWRVHIRKPRSTTAEIAALVAEVDARLRSQITLHYAQEAAVSMGVGGVHLNGRCGRVPDGFEGVVSCSTHSLAEAAARSEECDYLFLSPVFDSISKQGYCSAFGAEELSRVTLPPNTFALGGVTPESFEQLCGWGFAGGAMLGCAWGEGTSEYIDKFIERLKCCNL